MSSITVRSAALLFIVTPLCGCNFSRPYPAKEHYSINVPAPASYSSDRLDVGLRVADVRIAPPYDTQSFHYTTTPNRLEPDYYVNFITQPGAIITGELVQFLSASGPYAVTVDGSSAVSTARTLETRVSALYGDYTNTPQAVITAKFFLLDTRTADPSVLLEKEYTQSIPLGAQDPASLVAGWSDALRQILENLSHDLAIAESAMR